MAQVEVVAVEDVRPTLVDAAWAQGHVERGGVCAQRPEEGLRLCFGAVFVDAAGEPSERWLVEADLAVLGVGVDALVAQTAAATCRRLGRVGDVSVRADLGLRVWQGTGRTGWDGGVVLCPEVLQRRLRSGSVRLASPAIGVVLAWSGGSEQGDLAAAVGVHEAYVGAEFPVSDVVLSWDARAWRPYARAGRSTPR
jgi:hypothetical protein